MKLREPRIESQRLRLWFLLAGLLIVVSTVTRTALLIKSWRLVEPDIVRIAGIYLVGFFFDCVNAIYFSLPLVLFLWLTSEKAFQKSWHVVLVALLFLIQTVLLIFNSAAEW